MTHVRVGPLADFKNCCMGGRKHDGSNRHYFFQGVASSNYALERNGHALERARVRARLIVWHGRAPVRALQPSAQRGR